jgi:hypothetical protein
MLASWYVAAAQDEDDANPSAGFAVSWCAYAQENGTLSYDGGRYFTGQGADINRRNALASAAERAGVQPEQATEATEATEATRNAFHHSRIIAMTELTGGGIARPVVRDALMEAAATGRSLIRLPSGSHRFIRYDRAAGEFTITAN